MRKIAEWFESWKLISWRTALVVALVLYTLIGFFVVPWVAERIIVKVAHERLGREVTVERIRCNPFTLSLTVEGLSLPDRPGSVMLSFDELYANLQASSLFRWALTLKEVQILNPLIALRRFEDGGINILELEEVLEASVDLSGKAFGLPRALLRDVRVTGGRIEIEDHARPEPLLWHGGPAELVLREISTIPNEQGTHDISVGLPAGGTIRIDGSVVIEPFGLEGSLSIDRILAENLWPAVAHKFEFEVEGGVLSADLEYYLWLDDEGLAMRVDGLEARVSDATVRASGSELLEAESVVVSGGSLVWPDAQLEVESVVVEGASAAAWIESDGTPIWMTLVPVETRQDLLDLWRRLEEKYSPVAVLHRLEVNGARAAFEDRTFSEPVKLDISNAELVVTEISSEAGAKWGLEASAALAGGAPATATGSLAARPLTLDAEVGLDGLELARFQPYVARYVPIELRAGQLTATGRAHVAPSDEAPDATFEGQLFVEDLNLVETVTDSALLKWGELRVDGVQAALLPTSAEVAQVDINDAGLEIVVGEDGTINVLEFLKAIAEELDNLPPVHVARVGLHDCFGRYLEESPTRPFELALESVNGTVTGFATDASTTAELEVDAAIATGGLARITGELDPFDYARMTDMAVDVRDVRLPPLSPKSIEIVGHPVDLGTATLDLSIEISEQHLISENHVEIDNLELGERVEGDRLIDLPVKFGVSLLKDKNGQIILDIPVEGDLGNPNFVVAAAFQSAVTELVGEIAKAPFRLLGRLVGGSDDQDLEFVDFVAGSAGLEDHVRANLATLAKALAERPSLVLEIAGPVDPEADTAALRQAALASRLAAEGVEVEAMNGAQVDRIEQIFQSQLPEADLAAIRSEHTSGGEEPLLDEAAYRRVLLDRLADAQPVDEAEVQALGAVRAEAIRAYLVDQSGVDATRVEVLPEPAMVTDSDKWVRCKLVLREAG